MPKYLLLKHYRGGPEPHRPAPPMDQWAPEDVEAHTCTSSMATRPLRHGVRQTARRATNVAELFS